MQCTLQDLCVLIQNELVSSVCQHSNVFTPKQLNMDTELEILCATAQPDVQI